MRWKSSFNRKDGIRKMSILQVLEESLHSDAPCYMEFLYRYDPKKQQCFAFYEGDEDSSFYHHFLKEAIGDDCALEEIVAGCKNNIIKLHKEFNWGEYSARQILFFVDRDLSYWLNESDSYGDNVFITDEYSIENYIVNSQGFLSWLTHFEGFARAKKSELDGMLSEFESNIASFKREMIPIMAQAVVAKRHDSSISLSDFKISKNSSIHFNMCDGHLAFQIHMDDRISEKWKLSSEDLGEITGQIARFEEDLANYSVRGKWILCFMAEIGEYMRLNSDVFAPSLKSAGKVSPTCAVPPSQCFCALAPYCVEVIPKRLEALLDNTYRMYISEKIASPG